MTILRRTLHLLSISLVSSAVWSATAEAAWAQAAAPANKGYTTQYLLVILIIGLPLMLVLRSVGRSKDIKPR